MSPPFAAGGKTISRAVAQKTALESVKGGIVKDAEFQDENGVKIWSFEIEAGCKQFYDTDRFQQWLELIHAFYP